MKRSLLLLLSVAAAPLCAQDDETPAPRPVAELVWTALQAAEPEAKIALRALRLAKTERSAVTAILDAGPPRPVPTPGILRDQPIAVPGTPAMTTYVAAVPEGLEQGRRYPLWIGIHGTGGQGRSELGPLWRARGKRKIFVAAPTEASDIHGRGWGYRARERDLHLAVIEDMARRFPIDRNRVFVVGHSRGGHASFDLAVRYTDRLAGAVPVIGGLPWRDLPLADNLHDLRLHALNGARDQPALVAGVTRAMERLKKLEYPATSVLDPERGHSGFQDHYPAVFEHMDGRTRPVAPRKLQFRLQDPAHGRHYWLRVTKLSTKAYAPGKPITIPAGTPKNETARRKAWAKGIEKRTASVKAKWQTQRGVSIETRHVREIELFIPAQLAEPGAKLKVRVNGRLVQRAYRVPDPGGSKLLSHSRAFRTTDPAFRFLGRMTLKVR